MDFMFSDRCVGLKAAIFWLLCNELLPNLGRTSGKTARGVRR